MLRLIGVCVQYINMCMYSIQHVYHYTVDFQNVTAGTVAKMRSKGLSGCYMIFQSPCNFNQLTLV